MKNDSSNPKAPPAPILSYTTGGPPIGPADQPPAPPAPPREVTAAVMRRIWMEPRVRLWWILAAGMILALVYVAGTELWTWRQECELIQQGTVVTARVDPTIGGDRRLKPGEVADLTFTFQGKQYEVNGPLVGQTDYVPVNSDIQIRVDPADPTRWTDRSVAASPLWNLFGISVTLPIVPILIAMCLLRRRRVLEAWKSGKAQLAMVVSRSQSALAPSALEVRCNLIEGRDKRLFRVYVPRGKNRLEHGQTLWLLFPPTGQPIAASWIEARRK